MDPNSVKTITLSEELMNLSENIKEKLTSQEYLELTKLISNVNDSEDAILYATVIYPIMVKCIENIVTNDVQKPKIQVFMQNLTLMIHKTDCETDVWKELEKKSENRYGLSNVDFHELEELLPDYHFDHLMSFICFDGEECMSMNSSLILIISKNY